MKDKRFLPYVNLYKKTSWRQYDTTSPENRLYIEEKNQRYFQGVSTLFGTADDIDCAEALVKNGLKNDFCG